MKRDMLLCPVCGATLKDLESRLACHKGHSFDVARTGYVNLLRSAKSGDRVGDSKEMVAARREFLDAGYYRPLAEALADMVEAARPSGSLRLLDAGCGEGFYTRCLANAFPDSTVVGVDISRSACQSAAGRDKASLYLTASTSALPLRDSWADGIVSAFAPVFPGEFGRVLDDSGFLLLAVPGRDHLMELKEAVYREPYPNREDKHAVAGFEIRRQKRVRYPIRLEEPGHIRQLFAMTPYAHRTPREGLARLEQLAALTTTADFLLLLFRRDRDLPKGE